MIDATYDLSIAIIATRNYCGYAVDLIKSVSERVSAGGGIQTCIFTDNPTAFRGLRTRFANTIHSIPSYGWPQATLFRNRILASNGSVFRSRMTMYIDADALISSAIHVSELEKLTIDGRGISAGMCFVNHPGYANRSMVVRGLIRTCIGPWETRADSLAYVPKEDRRIYLCGGVYWGETKSFVEMSSTLAEWTERDLERGIVAKHHDESYLNRWAVLNSHTVAGPEWAHASQLRHLRNLVPRISVLVKPDGFKQS